MKIFYKELIKHMIIYFIFMKNSLISYMEYRANLFAALTMELAYLASKLLYVIVIYNSGIKINGVSPDEIMIFIGTFIIMTAVYTGLFVDNFYELPEYIRNGTLDTYITKPISLQFIVTLKHVNFVIPIPNLIAGISMIVIACRRLGITANFINISGYIGFLISATAITYSVFLAPLILSFWTVKSSAICEISNKCWDFNNMPMIIYNKWIQRIGVYIIPVFFITNFPSIFLLQKLSGTYFIWTFIAPIIFIVFVRLFWKFAIRSYTSASS